MLLDTRELRRALRKLSIVVQKSEGEMLSQAAGKIAIFASAKTDVADKNRIKSRLQQVTTKSTRLRFTKRGKVRKQTKRVARWQGTIGAAVFAKTHKGRIPPTRTAFYAAVDKWFRRKLRSVRWHKVGWIPALMKFAKRKGRGASFRSSVPPGWARLKGKSIGSRAPATAEATNTIRALAKRQPNIVKEAVSETTAFIKRSTRQKLAKSGKLAGFLVRNG